MLEKKVTVIDIKYPPPNVENPFHIIETDIGIIKGKMSWRPSEGDMLKIEGDYEIYKGQRQFLFKSALADIPVSSYDQLVYICGKTKGFGSAMITRIWDKWESDWKELMEPDVVKSLGEKKFDLLVEAVKNLEVKQAESEAVAWLIGKGATPNMAQAAWELWESNVIGVVNANCYSLTELKNYGFADIDTKIRHEFGIGDTDPRRVEAAVIYALKQLTSSGSTAIDWNSLRNSTCALIGGHNHDLALEAVNSMFEKNVLVGFKATTNISLKSDFYNAQDIWGYVSCQ